jgi:hypothetical protein
MTEPQRRCIQLDIRVGDFTMPALKPFVMCHARKKEECRNPEFCIGPECWGNE